MHCRYSDFHRRKCPFTFRLGENRNVPWFTDSIYHWIVPPFSETVESTYIYATDRRGVWGLLARRFDGPTIGLRYLDARYQLAG